MVLFSQVTEDNTNRFPGAQKYGGWIVDNCPVIRDLWMAFIEKEIVPDLVISFTDGENNGKCFLNRIYLKNKHEVDAKILERLQHELQTKKKEEEEIRKAKEEELRLEEEKQRMMETVAKKEKGRSNPGAGDSPSERDPWEKVVDVEEGDNEAEEEVEGEDFEAHEESEAPEMQEEARGSLLPEESEAEVPEAEHEPEPVSETPEDTAVEVEISKEPKEVLEPEDVSEAVVLPEFPEDAYPSVPEMEPLKEELNNYLLMWKHMEQIITDNLIQILTLDISNKTPKELLQKVVETMESKAPSPVLMVKSRHSH
ncbi:hypothetical protein U0070_003154 [Myodes glareolus]|uniref:Uncharacterized protein n=1 Tax=Myodes glareolus TaxID=447135 RepID=A0AAW0I2A8_MYOGA